MPTVRIFNNRTQNLRPVSAVGTTRNKPTMEASGGAAVSVGCWAGCCTHYARAAFCLFLVLLAFVLDVIGFATNYWYCQTTATGKMFGGLWKDCNEVNDVVTCTILANGTSATWFRANQALQSIGMILLLTAVVVILVIIICCKKVKEMRIAAIAFLLGAATFILIGVIIYGARSDNIVTSNLNYSFAFVVTASGLAILGAICLCMGVNDDWDDDEED